MATTSDTVRLQEYGHCDSGHGYCCHSCDTSAIVMLSVVVVCHTGKSMGSRKDKTSGMACILSDYYSTSGETSFLFIPMYRCKPLSVNELILSLNLLLTAHGKFL